MPETKQVAWQEILAADPRGMLHEEIVRKRHRCIASGIIERLKVDKEYRLLYIYFQWRTVLVQMIGESTAVYERRERVALPLDLMFVRTGTGEDRCFIGRSFSGLPVTIMVRPPTPNCQR